MPESLWTLPNLLSLLRVLLIPVFLWFMHHDQPGLVFAVFLLAASTDFLDGIAARVSHQRTRLGAYLDPAADKLLMTAAFLFLTSPRLSSPNTIPIWLTIVVIGRDVLIVAGALILYRLYGRTNFDPTLPGKLSTICQMSVLVLVLFLNMLRSSPPLLPWLYGLTGLLTTASFGHYVTVGLGMIEEARRSRRPV